MTQRRIYQHAYPNFVTTVVRDRAPAFAHERAALHLAEIILGACALKSFDALAWAILPDHLHLLVWKSEVMRDMDAVQRVCGTQRMYDNMRCEGEIIHIPKAQRTLSHVRHHRSHVRDYGAHTHDHAEHARGPHGYTPYGANPYATISELMKCIKGTFAHEMGDRQFWQKRFYARIVDSDRYLRNVLRYTQYNHVKHGLPERYARWPYSYCNI